MLFRLSKNYFIIGLGNPGKKYENTRHNVGFKIVDKLAAELSVERTQIKHKAIIGETKLADNKIYLIKPQTYMNLSGESLRSIVDWYKIPLEDLIIVYDDIDLELGKIRIRKKGSAGSHNGMRSIIYHLVDDGFPRVRVGIGKNPENFKLVDYVIGNFAKDEIKIIEQGIDEAVNAILSIIKLGIDEAMNKYN